MSFEAKKAGKRLTRIRQKKASAPEKQPAQAADFERVTLWVVVPRFEHEAAERLAKDYAPDGLEGVLAAFVSDMATMAARPGSWEADRVGSWLASHPWPRPEKEGA